MVAGAPVQPTGYGVMSSGGLIIDLANKDLLLLKSGTIKW